MGSVLEGPQNSRFLLLTRFLTIRTPKIILASWLRGALKDDPKPQGPKPYLTNP